MAPRVAHPSRSRGLRPARRRVERVERGEAALDIDEKLELTGKIMALAENLKTEFTPILGASVAFEPGGTEPSDRLADGPSVLDALADSVRVAQLPEYRRKFPGDSLRVGVSTTGCADEVVPGDSLARERLRTEPGPVPDRPGERRRFLDRILSVRRSETIGRYVRDRREFRLPETDVRSEPGRGEGSGETFPADPDTVGPPFRTEDAR